MAQLHDECLVDIKTRSIRDGDCVTPCSIGKLKDFIIEDILEEINIAVMNKVNIAVGGYEALEEENKNLNEIISTLGDIIESLRKENKELKIKLAKYERDGYVCEDAKTYSDRMKEIEELKRRDKHNKELLVIQEEYHQARDEHNLATIELFEQENDMLRKHNEQIKECVGLKEINK